MSDGAVHEAPAGINEITAAIGIAPERQDWEALASARRSFEADRGRLLEVDVEGSAPFSAPAAASGEDRVRQLPERAESDAERPIAGQLPVADRSVAGILAALANGETGSEELTRIYLERAAASDDRVGVYISRFDDAALEAARDADRDRGLGRAGGPLLGLPISVKDMIATREAPSTCQSRVPPLLQGGADAPAVARLRDAGAVILGKVTLSEFACGPPDPSSPYPLPRNPWDPARRPGGSSSGSGAGIAAGFFPCSLGTDTTGSIRMPAALCGVTGFKPTPGVVPTAGMVPLAWSFDTIGPLARTARDCRLLLDVLASTRTAARARGKSLANVPIGVDRAHLQLGAADPSVDGAFDGALAVLRDAGARLVPVSIPDRAAVGAAARIVFMCEAFSEHQGRLSGHWASYLPATRASLLAGAWCTAADYLRAQRVLARANAQLARLFERVAVIVSPTVAIEAPRYQPVPEAEYRATGELLGLSLTNTWSALRCPALSVPMGVGRDVMPVGLQVAGPPLADRLVLAVGEAYQSLTGWHERRPES